MQKSLSLTQTFRRLLLSVVSQNAKKEAFYLKNRHFSQTFLVLEITRNSENVISFLFFFLSLYSLIGNMQVKIHKYKINFIHSFYYLHNLPGNLTPKIPEIRPSPPPLSPYSRFKYKHTVHICSQCTSFFQYVFTFFHFNRNIKISSLCLIIL